MSVSTHLKLLTLCETWVRGEQSNAALLESTLPYIQEVVKNARTLTVYHLEGYTLQPMGATHTAPLEAQKVNPHYASALANNEPEYDTDRHCWIVPINVGAQPYGVLEVQAEGITPPEDRPAHSEWLALCGAQIAQALAWRGLRNTHPMTITQELFLLPSASNRQKNAFNEMVMGQSLPTMLSIISRHLFPDGVRHAALYALNRDERERVTNWQLIAHDHPLPAETLAEIQWQHLSDTVRFRLIDSELYRLNQISEANPALCGEKFIAWHTHHQHETIALFPVMSGGVAIAVLMVTSASVNAITDEESNALESLVAQMGVLTQVQNLHEGARAVRDAVDNLALASRLVTMADDFSYMAQGVIYTVAREMLAVSVTLFDQLLGENQSPQYRRIVGLSTLYDILVVDDTRHYADLPDREQLSNLRASLPVILSPLDGENSYLSEQSRTVYEQIGAVWGASFGIRVGELLLGTLDILHSEPHTLSQSEIDSYTTLADQIGANIRSRQLLNESQRARALADQLLQVNSLIATAQDYEDMASAVIRAMPENIAMAGILLFDDEITLREMPRYMQAEVFATRETVENPDAVDMLSTEDYTAVQAIKTLIDGELLFERDHRQLKQNPIPNICAYLATHELYSFAAIGLRKGSRLLGAIAFVAEDSAALESLSLDNLKAIAGQVAIAAENRNLINQTTDSLAFVSEQYEASNALFRAQSNRDMLRALYRMSRDFYDTAELGIVASDGVTLHINVKLSPDGTSNTEFDDQTLYTRPAPDALAQTPAGGILYDEDRRELILPLFQRNGSLIGAAHFSNPDPVQMPFNKERALRSLADQMAVLLENRYLLQQTDKALNETRTLYEMSQALVTARDPLDILKAIKSTIADRAHTLTLVDLDVDPITEQIKAYDVQALITPDTEEICNDSLADKILPADLEAYQNKWNTLGNQIEFTELAKEITIAQDPIYGYLRDRGIKLMSSIIVPLVDEGLLRQMIHVGFNTPNLFSERDQRLYAALRDQAGVVLENRRLLRDVSISAGQLGQQVRVLQALNQLAANLSAIQDEGTLMDEAAQSLVTALRVDHVGITLLNADRKSATVVGEAPRMGMIGVTISGDNPLQQQIMASRQPIIIPDVEAEAEISPEAVRAMRDAGIKAVMFYPMVTPAGEFLGSVGLDSNDKAFVFNQQVIETTRTIASQIIITLQNIRQLKSTQRQAEQLQLLAQLSQSAQTALDRETILTLTLNELPSIITLDHINLYLINLEKREAWLYLQSNRGETRQWDEENAPRCTVTPTVLLDVWQSRVARYVEDTQTPNAPFHSTDVDGLRSVMVAALITRGVVTGLLEVACELPYAFSNADHIIFRQLANQISVAIENTEAYIQTQRVAQSKAMVNDISSHLQQQLDFESLLSVTINELGQALGARKGRIRLGKSGEE